MITTKSYNYFEILEASTHHRSKLKKKKNYIKTHHNIKQE